MSPNVRLAADQDEVAALALRLKDARAQLLARKCEDVGNAFIEAASNSQAVICRSIGQLLELVSSPNSLYSTFYNQVDAQSRLPQENEFDLRRAVVDAIIFPHFYRSVVFAALTLDGLGVVAYGACSIVLKEIAFAHRASVFHENSFQFVKDHKLQTTDTLPRGYRATWERRSEIALAKLHGRLNDTTDANSFPSILLRQKTHTVQDDFVEVHIFGGFSRGAIEKVVMTTPDDKIEQQLLKGVIAKTKAASIPVEMR